MQRFIQFKSFLLFGAPFKKVPQILCKVQNLGHLLAYTVTCKVKISKNSLDKIKKQRYNKFTEQMFGKRWLNERKEKPMSTGFVLISIFEFAVAAFIIYGLINEEKFSECERKFFGSISRYIKRYISGNSFQKQ